MFYIIKHLKNYKLTHLTLDPAKCLPIIRQNGEIFKWASNFSWKALQLERVACIFLEVPEQIALEDYSKKKGHII